MRRWTGLFAAAVLPLVVLVAVIGGACSGGSAADQTSTTAPGGASATATTDTEVTVPPIPKTVAADGAVVLGELAGIGFTLVLPADAYPGVTEVSAAFAPSSAAPAMTGATPLGDGYQVDTGGVGRLDSGAVLTLRFDPARTPDPSLLALGYHDGSAWTYVFATAVDPGAGTVTFPLYHFSAYYPAQFASELEAAKHYAGPMATQKVLGEGGGDPKVASRLLADLLATKLGLGEDEFAKRMFADIAADQEVVKVFDQYMRDGWTDTGYALVMDALCGKVAERLEKAKGELSTAEAGLANMWDILKIGNAGGKIVGALSEGDTNAAGKELFDLVTDYTGVPGKALKYTLQGMQNALDVWRDGEVEKAFRVYTQGASGTLFGYGAVDPGDFEAVWDNMKGASRQLCLERIRKENQARQLLGLAPLSPKEEDLYREKVKQELKSEFERRLALKGKIEAQKKNLELIFTELDAARLFDSTNIWIRKIDPNETLEARLTRFNQLINRIFRDLKIETVYPGPQQEGPLGGRLSAMAMAQMLRGYFAANTQAEGEKFLQEYYKRFEQPLTNEDLGGTWTLSGEMGKGQVTIVPSGSGGTVGGFDAPQGQVWPYAFSGDTLTFKVYYEPYRVPDGTAYGRDATASIKFSRSGGKIVGQMTFDGFSWDGLGHEWRGSYRFDMEKID